MDLCSFLPMKCVHKCVDESHKISCYSYYTLIHSSDQWEHRQTRVPSFVYGGSKYFEMGQQPHEYIYSIFKVVAVAQDFHLGYINYDYVTLKPYNQSS